MSGPDRRSQPVGGNNPLAATPAPGRLCLTGLTIAIALGMLLRLSWKEDIEYKQDELWTFEHTQQVARGGPIPKLGMPMSVGLANPGMSIWFFIGLDKIFASREPPDLARAVQICNVLAIVLLVWHAFRMVSSAERESWLWAIALVSLNPSAVAFHRKIWAQSTLPIFTAIFLMAWWQRERWWGAFLCGSTALVMGQIHLSGFFFLAGLVGWLLLFNRKSISWRGFTCGIAVGILPMYSWLQYLITFPISEYEGSSKIGKGSNILFFWYNWIRSSSGTGLNYQLGGDFRDFLKDPIVDGRATYIIAICHIILAAIMAIMLIAVICGLVINRNTLIEIAKGKFTQTAFVQNATIWGFGSLLIIGTPAAYVHYLIIAFPIPCLWLSRQILLNFHDIGLTLRLARILLLLMCVLNGIISFAFLNYVHRNQRLIAGDYGMPYHAQVAGNERSTQQK